MKLNIYFTDSILNFRGYIQIWAITDLKNFLADSKARSPFNFTYYSLDEHFTLKSSKGFREDWGADFGDMYISAREHWLKLPPKNEAVRISFLSDTAAFPDKLKPVVDQILNSLEVNTN